MNKPNKLTNLILFLTISISFNIDTLAEECLNWEFTGKLSPIKAQSCYENYSGTFKIQNTSHRPARVGYIIIFNDGRRDKYSTNLEPGETSRISCYSCNPNKGSRGVKGVEIYKHAYRGEDGYW